MLVFYQFQSGVAYKRANLNKMFFKARTDCPVERNVTLDKVSFRLDIRQFLFQEIKISIYNIFHFYALKVNLQHNMKIDKQDVSHFTIVV